MRPRPNSSGHGESDATQSVAVNEAAVRALAIAQHPAAALARQLRMLARDGVHRQLQIRRVAAADHQRASVRQRPCGRQARIGVGVQQHQARAGASIQRAEAGELLHRVCDLIGHREFSLVAAAISVQSAGNVDLDPYGSRHSAE